MTGEPSLLFFAGDFLDKAMRKARVTRDEVRAAVRSAGFASLAEVEAVVMETDGSFSVIRRGDSPDFSSFEGIRNEEQAREKTA